MQYSLPIDCIFNEIKQGVIIVDQNGIIIFLNEEATKLAGATKSNALGKHISELVPNSELPRVIRSGKKETGKRFVLAPNCNVRISRIPLINKKEQTIGAIAYFSNASDYKEDWYEKDNLQAIVELLVQNNEAAISIVDEKGSIKMKNFAYCSWIESLNKDSNYKQAIISKDLSETVHQKVLQTRRVQQHIENNNKRSLKIDASPIIIDGKLKGSVQIVQDLSKSLEWQKELKMARSIIRGLEEKYLFEDIVSSSPAMQIPIQQGKLASNTDCPVFIRGALGTGKKMFANAIHNESKRKYNQFAAISCMNTSEKELDTILARINIGNDKNEDNAAFQQKWHGTVYLDEISFLPFELQQKLLDFLQNKKDNIRIIAGSSENMEKTLINGQFLEGLYYELTRISIHLPLLTERKEDIPLLTKRFVQQINHNNGRFVTVHQEVMKLLKDYPFTGNIKELKAILELSLTKMAKTEVVLTKNNLCFADYTGAEKKESLHIKEEHEIEDKPLSLLVEEYEKVIIEKALKKNEGNKTLTAKSLGLSVRNLYYKLEKYGLG
ncbi:MAG: sigma 54-interacting transcriptional regulator [Bacillus sp. (in: firmicutes)]